MDNVRFNPASGEFFPQVSSINVQGSEMTMEQRVIAALVKKLGGSVELQPYEWENIYELVGHRTADNSMKWEAR